MGYYAETDEVYGSTGVLVGVGTDAMGTTAGVRHIERADNIINTTLSKRYTVPFDTGTATPPVIKTIAIDLSAYFIMRSLFTKDNQNDSDWVDELKATAMDMLGKLESGETNLMDVNNVKIGQITSGAGDIYSNTKDYTPIFNVDKPLAWKVDSDRSDDIADDRDD